MNRKEYIHRLIHKKQVLTKEFKEPQSRVKRIPIELVHEFERIGNGDWKKGMTATLISHNIHNPDEILMKDCDQLMYHLNIYYGENHKHHFRNFPAFFRMFLQTGKPNIKILEEK